MTRYSGASKLKKHAMLRNYERAHRETKLLWNESKTHLILFLLKQMILCFLHKYPEAIASWTVLPECWNLSPWNCCTISAVWTGLTDADLAHGKTCRYPSSGAETVDTANKRFKIVFITPFSASIFKTSLGVFRNASFLSEWQAMAMLFLKGFTFETNRVTRSPLWWKEISKQIFRFVSARFYLRLRKLYSGSRSGVPKTVFASKNRDPTT